MYPPLPPSPRPAVPGSTIRWLILELLEQIYDDKEYSNPRMLAIVDSLLDYLEARGI